MDLIVSCSSAFRRYAADIAGRLALVALSSLILFSAAPAVAAPKETRSPLYLYLYQDTRQLVRLVEDAAGQLELRGPAFFKELGRPGSRWFNDKYYFFVYDLSGTCVFHAVEPELVGKNLMGLRDMNGKPVVKMITDIGTKAGKRASGWVFYLWEEGTQITPLWKSSYVRKVRGPDGKIYLIGSGSYNLKMEKEFVKETVDLAVEELLTEGKDAAFRDFRNPASPFVFCDTYIFVLRMDGRSLVDPAYPTHAGRDLSRFRDAIGVYVVREMIEKLQHADTAWVQYMWPRPGASLPSRKVAYVRKVKIGDESFIVGADFFIATPIWMRS
jgi:hypothetical protein